MIRWETWKIIKWNSSINLSISHFYSSHLFFLWWNSELKLKKYDEMQLRLEEKEKEIRTNLKNRVLKKKKMKIEFIMSFFLFLVVDHGKGKWSQIWEVRKNKDLIIIFHQIVDLSLYFNNPRMKLRAVVKIQSSIRRYHAYGKLRWQNKLIDQMNCEMIFLFFLMNWY